MDNTQTERTVRKGGRNVTFSGFTFHISTKVSRSEQFSEWDWDSPLSPKKKKLSENYVSASLPSWSFSLCIINIRTGDVMSCFCSFARHDNRESFLHKMGFAFWSFHQFCFFFLFDCAFDCQYLKWSRHIF